MKKGDAMVRVVVLIGVLLGGCTFGLEHKQRVQAGPMAAFGERVSPRAPAPQPPCDVLLKPGDAIPWPPTKARARPQVFCLSDGVYDVGIEPPKGVGEIVIRSVNYGGASVKRIKLEENAVAIDGVRVQCSGCPGGSAVWTRTLDVLPAAQRERQP
jgi:hypothetical protein